MVIKNICPQEDMSTFNMVAEQSPTSVQHVESNLDHRYQSLHRRRQFEYDRNLITSSPKYQAYRAKQRKNEKGAKWPEILEGPFLDALIDVPAMGRRKFSFKGKPHGRNEVISEYIWIAYLQSLPPGQPPDPSMKRGRKKVMSHIKVLKDFVKGHPAYDRLFPETGSEDSFENDPCLRALVQGRLPDRQCEQFNDLEDVPMKSQHTPLQPTIFWLLVTSADIQDDCGDLYEKDTVTHRYSRLSSQAHPARLDFLLNWCEKFPYLEPHDSARGLDCEIIHMDVLLNLMGTHARDGADLVTRSEMSVPNHGNENCEWQTVTNLIKPPELCRYYDTEQHCGASVAPAKILSSNATETRLKVRFPAEEWAHIFTRLTDVQLKYETNERYQAFGSERFMGAERPAEEYLRQVSMYQEIQSSSGPGMPFTRRAIVLWTFRATTPGAKAETTWRYVDATLLQSCVSPSSESSHQLSATTTNGFNSSPNSPLQFQVQQHGVFDPFMRGLITSPSPAGLQSTFSAESYGYQDRQFTMPSENFNFESITPSGSDLTLVNNNITANIEAYIANATNTRMVGFNRTHLDWDAIPSGLLHAGSTWTNYAAIPSDSPHTDGESAATSQSWRMDIGPRLAHWTEFKDVKDEWAEINPSKQNPIYTEQDDDKLLSWLDPADTEPKDAYIEADDIQLPILHPRLTDTRDPSWVGSDSGFDFQLVERMSA